MNRTLENTACRRRRMRLERAAALLAACLMFASGCGRGAANGTAGGAAGAPAAMLGAQDVFAAKRVDLASGVLISGTLEPSVDVRITAPFAETLEEVRVKEGQTVRRGDLLALLRASALEPAAASAEARERVALADNERMQNLFKEGAVARRDVESADATLRAAQSDRAAVAKRLSEARVVAPADGVIATRFVQAGHRVMEGDALFRLVNTRELEFEATVPAEAAHEVSIGAEVTLDVAGFPAGSVTGRVARVNAAADPATRQVKVYVVIPNADGRLVGDLFASGRVVTAERKNAVAIPTAGVHSDAGGREFAWVISRGVAARRAVTTGLEDSRQDLVEVTGGIAEGDTTIVGPVEGLQEGQRVAAASPAPSSSQAGS